MWHYDKPTFPAKSRRGWRGRCGHTYRTLDDFATLAAAQANPESLLEGAVILDEVQRRSAMFRKRWRVRASHVTLHPIEQGRHEVDFVIEVGRGVFAIEVKAATRGGESDLSGLRAFLERTPACVAAVLACNGKEAAKLGERLFAIPLGKLLE
jgi:hypothetical protein